MIEKIKEKIWDLLKDKEVSLAMIFDDQGEILWHRGRQISESKTLSRGCGYCSTPALQAIKKNKNLHIHNCSVSYGNIQNWDSARPLKIKSLVILPITDHYFLYADSGIKEGFSEKDITVFETLGSLFGGIIQNLRSGFGGHCKISGSSTLAAGIREKIAKYAIEEEPVLLLGETGVGKSLAAEMIHTYSGRKGAFVVVHTPGIPDTLLEAQLFGHRRGAFSGAVTDSKGFVEASEGGTLFLDEIAELQPALQAKLLRFIDTRFYHRVGETHEKKAAVRILAATNQDLTTAVEQKTFREDLFFRLNCLSIEIPPLRQRREDIRTLVEDNQALLRGKKLTSVAMEVLHSYHWPGNVRELMQVLKSAGIHFSGNEIGEEIREILAFGHHTPAARHEPVEHAWQELKAGRTFWEAVKKPYLNRDLNRTEVMAILEMGLRETKGVYRGLLKLFNLNENEYKNFMSFLYDNELK